MVSDNHDTKFRYMVSLYDPRQMPVRPIIPIQLVLIHHSFMGVRSLWTLHRADYLTVESSGDGAHSRLTHGSERGKDHNDNGSTR